MHKLPYWFDCVQYKSLLTSLSTHFGPQSSIATFQRLSVTVYIHTYIYMYIHKYITKHTFVGFNRCDCCATPIGYLLPPLPLADCALFMLHMNCHIELKSFKANCTLISLLCSAFARRH